MDIRTYRIFISHSYAHRQEYSRLVAMLNRASERDPDWSWDNLSVPHDVPLMTDEEATQGETYIVKMTERKAHAHVVLLILRPEAIDSESVFSEACEAIPGGRPEVPVIGILPRGMKLEDWNENWGVVTVRGNATSIIRAMREIAAPTTEEELQLDLRDATERTKIIDRV